MSMPIYGDMKDVTFQSHPFYPVVESPGVVFIVKKEDSSNAAQAVMEAVFQGWPVLLLTLIMAALSGIVVWALVSKCTLETYCRLLLVILVTLDGIIWSNSVTLACALRDNCWKFSWQQTNKIYHKMYFIRIVALQTEKAIFSCFFVIVVVLVQYTFFK